MENCIKFLRTAAVLLAITPAIFMAACDDGSNTAPGTPTNVTATALSSSSIRISWNAPSSGGTPTYYNIWRSTSATGTYTEVSYVSGSTTSYTDTGLNSSSTYYYRVDAENSVGRSSRSSYVYAMTQSSGGTVPGTPTNVTAVAQSSSSIRISWNAPSSGGTPTYYNIWRSTSSTGTYTEVGYVSGSTTSYTDTSLSASTLYYYKVDAQNSAGRSPQSSYAYALTNSSTTTRPGTPTNVTVIPQSSSSARISWNAPSSGGTPTYYNIWRSTSATGTYTEIGYVSGSTTSYTDTGLNSFSTYYYRVDAENSAGRSSQSSYVYIVPYLLTLTNGVWRTSSVDSSNDQVWFSFTVTNGTTYRIWVDDTDNYSGSRTADVVIMAYYSNGTQIWSYSQDNNWSTAASFTANSSGTVYVKVEPYSNNSINTGTFGIVYSTSTSRPVQ